MLFVFVLFFSCRGKISASCTGGSFGVVGILVDCKLLRCLSKCSFEVAMIFDKYLVMRLVVRHGK